MSAARDAALKGVDSALSDAVSKISGTYQLCLVDAGGDASKEAACQASRDRGLNSAKRAYVDMLDAVNQQWPQGS
jgi:hypothetical protein